MRSAGLVWSLIVILLLGGCSGAPEMEVQDSGWLPRLPDPASLSQLRAASLTRTVQAVDFDPAVVEAQRVSQTEDLLFTPDPADPSLAGAAYAAYSISAKGLESCLWSADWASTTPGSRMFLAWANFHDARWDWFSLEPGQSMQQPSLSGYVSPADSIILIILIYGPGDCSLSSFSLKSMEPPHWDVVEVDWRIPTGTGGAQAPELAVHDGRPIILYNWTTEDSQQRGTFCAYSSDPEGGLQEHWNTVRATGRLLATDKAGILVEEQMLAFSLLVSGGPGSAFSAIEYYTAPEAAGPWERIEIIDENGNGLEYGRPCAPVMIDGHPALLYGYSVNDQEMQVYARANGPTGTETWDLYFSSPGVVASGLIEVDGRPAYMVRQDKRLYWQLGTSGTPVDEDGWISLQMPDTGNNVAFGYFRDLLIHQGNIYFALDYDSLNIWHCSLESMGLSGWQYLDDSGEDGLPALDQASFHELDAVGSRLAVSCSDFGPIEYWLGSGDLSQAASWEYLDPAPDRLSPSESSALQKVSACEVLGRPAVAYCEQKYDENHQPGHFRLFYAIYSELNQP
ncbi:hypothetical protein IT575_12585 [bacterium]|nr:hypothetical protein [bacterium]